MKISYDETDNSKIELNPNESIEEELIKFHVLMFRFMQTLSETYGMSLDHARKLCTMDDTQFRLMMLSLLQLGLESEESDEK